MLADTNLLHSREPAYPQLEINVTLDAVTADLLHR
jgi:hypothetical protein